MGIADQSLIVGKAVLHATITPGVVPGAAGIYMERQEAAMQIFLDQVRFMAKVRRWAIRLALAAALALVLLGVIAWL